MDIEHEKKLAPKATYYAANRDRVLAQSAAYYTANRDKILARNAVCYAANSGAINARRASCRARNREKYRAYQAAYHEANREKRLAYSAAYKAANREKLNASNAASAVRRYQTNPNVRIASIIRSHLHRIVKSGGVKDATSLSYVGCTVAQLRRHLERQFAPGMTWQNHGEWHIDHITPLAAFDFAAFPAQIKQAEHYTNLRPMWARDNLSKSATLLHPVQLELIAV